MFKFMNLNYQRILIYFISSNLDFLNIDPLRQPTAKQIQDLIPSLAGYYHKALPSVLPSTNQAAYFESLKFSIKHSTGVTKLTAEASALSL